VARIKKREKNVDTVADSRGGERGVPYWHTGISICYLGL